MEHLISLVQWQLSPIHTQLDWLLELYLVGAAFHKTPYQQFKHFDFICMVSISLPLPVGAGIFVTTVVAGSVALVKPFAMASRPFLRDVIFYMAAVFWTFVILYRGTISLGETLGTCIPTHSCLNHSYISQLNNSMHRSLENDYIFCIILILGYLTLYVVYVLTVIVSACIYNRQKHSLNSSVQTVTHVPGQKHIAIVYGYLKKSSTVTFCLSIELESSDSSDDIPSLNSRPAHQEYGRKLY